MTVVGWRKLTQLAPLFPMAEGHHVPLALPSSFWTANPTHQDSIREKKTSSFLCRPAQDLEGGGQSWIPSMP